MMMFRFSSLTPVVAAYYAVSVAHAAPQTVSPSQSICFGYHWGVIIQEVFTGPPTVYNQYLTTTSCNSPAWVQSSTLPNPPASVSPWGTIYHCEVPDVVYYCGETPVATCCGKQA